MSTTADPGGGRGTTEPVVSSAAEGNGLRQNARQNRSAGGGRHGVRSKQNNNDRPRNSIAELGTAFYRDNASADTYTATTRTIAEYVGRTVRHAGEFRTAMESGELRDLEEPAAPDDPQNPVSMLIYKQDYTEYRDKLRAREENQATIFPIIMSQCTQTIRDKLEAHENWDTANANNDVMELLGMIRECMGQRQMRKNAVHTLVDIEMGLFKLKQKNLSLPDYYQRFKDAIANIERLHGEIGMHRHRVAEIINEIAVDPTHPTENETDTARSVARDQYLAVLYIVNSDPNRYESVTVDLVNGYIKGRDEYPATLSEAHDYLTNHMVASHQRRSNVRRQHINTKSSTEAELVSVDDGMPLVVWTRNFLIEQGFTVSDNVVYQDNQNAMLLEKNGQASSGRRTRHINIRYFFRH